MSLYVHGFLGSKADWEGFIGPEDRAVDLPGHGESCALCLDLEATASWLGHKMGARRTVVAYSMGGRIALLGILTGRILAERLVLISSRPGLRTAKERLERLEADANWAALLREKGLQQFLLRWYQQSLFGHTVERKGNSEALAGALLRYSLGRQPALWDRLNETLCHVDIVVGEKDHKFFRLGEEMAKQLRKGRVHVVEGSFHAVHLERPKELMKIIGDMR